MFKGLRLIAITSLMLVLAACGHNNSPETSPNVLGMGTLTIDTSTGITTASLSDTFYSVNSTIEVVNASAPQITFTSSSVLGAGRVVRIQANIRDRSGDPINNLVLLGISVTGLDQNLSPLSNVTALGGGAITDQATIAEIKPAHAFTLDDLETTADFVAYAESDLDADFRSTLQRAAKVPLDAVLPYGFKVGDGTIPNQGVAAVNVAFFIPDGNDVGSFTYRFIAVEDTLTRFTQDVTELVLTNNDDPEDPTADTDIGIAGVRQRYGTIDSDKTIVLIGPYERLVDQSDIDAGIFTVLPDIRIMGTADNPIATLLDTGSSDLPTIVGN